MGVGRESDVSIHYLCQDLLHRRHLAGAYRVCPMRFDGAWGAAGGGIGVPKVSGPVCVVSVRKDHE